MDTAVPPSPEEKATRSSVIDHAKLVTLAHDVDDCWSQNKSNILVLDTSCRELAMFKSTKELLTVFADAVDAHQQALDKANILHRNVSVGNILITDKGRGLLLDWDVNKHVDDSACQPESTSAFQFLSARFVCDDYDFGPHDRLDDIESFFHTLQWIVLHFINHGMRPIRLGSTFFSTYDAVILRSDGFVHCHGRICKVWDSMWGVCGDFKGVLPDLLEDIREAVNARYIRPKYMHRPLAAYEHYLEQIKLGTPEEDTAFAARPAILYHQLIDPNWFRNRLREAAENPQCPNNDPSAPQAYVYPGRRYNPCIRQGPWTIS